MVEEEGSGGVGGECGLAEGGEDPRADLFVGGVVPEGEEELGALEAGLVDEDGPLEGAEGGGPRVLRAQGGALVFVVGGPLEGGSPQGFWELVVHGGHGKHEPDVVVGLVRDVG